MGRIGSVDIREAEGSLRAWLSGAGRVAVAGVGSPLRRDDFVGVEVVRGLWGRVSGSVYLAECETTPESFAGLIAEFRPTHVLVIDSAMLGLRPGCWRLIEPREIVGAAVSTHALPLGILCEYLAETTGARVALLAIQPKDTGFGEGLTPELRETTDGLADLLVELLPK